MKARPHNDLAPLGPVVRARLREIGIHDRQDLARRGACRAYADLLACAGGRSTPRCYYLFGLEGALRGQRWDAVPTARRQQLAESTASYTNTTYRPRMG